MIEIRGLIPRPITVLKWCSRKLVTFFYSVDSRSQLFSVSSFSVCWDTLKLRRDRCWCFLLSLSEVMLLTPQWQWRRSKSQGGGIIIAEEEEKEFDCTKGNHRWFRETKLFYSVMTPQKWKLTQWASGRCCVCCCVVCVWWWFGWKSLGQPWGQRLLFRQETSYNLLSTQSTSEVPKREKSSSAFDVFNSN